MKSFNASSHCRGRLNLPENGLLCAFGRIQCAPTVMKTLDKAGKKSQVKVA